jgi:CO/xanthine dehydrogenase Mo-binding subunit
MKEPPYPCLAQGKVRHVGERVAVVVAETRRRRAIAAELIEVDYEVLPAVTDGTKAKGAPRCTTSRRTTPATSGRWATRQPLIPLLRKPVTSRSWSS